MGDDEDSEQTINPKPIKLSVSTNTAFIISNVSPTMRQRRNDIKQEVGGSGQIPDNEVKDDTRLFFLWGHAVIEDYCAHLIRIFLIDGGFEETTWTYLDEGMSQSHREELLKQSGVFDGIESSIGNVRGLRNKFAHKPFEPLDWQDHAIESNMDRMIDILEELHTALTDKSKQEEIRNGNGLKQV